MSATAPVTNIAAYRFAELDGLKELRADLQRACKDWGLKGTILLSGEGINLFVAGADRSVDLLLERLRRIPGLEALEEKRSASERQPFNRMLVRIKREIISFGVDGVNPARHTSPKLAPAELKRWLDEGRPVTLLDTRNDYEVKLGTFRGALVPGIDSFRQFPEAVRRLPEELKDRPVVMFCTGGIRCEKAGPFMEMEGFREIYQLEGGILRYFEECGGEHYDGQCFVFDQRVGVDPALRESGAVVCFRCQAPLDETDQQDPRYVAGESCPYCHVPEPERQSARMAELQARLDAVGEPAPGSLPYENQRPIHVPGRAAGWSLIALLEHLFPHLPPEEWRRRCAEGRLRGEDGRPLAAGDVVREGQRVIQHLPMAAEPAVATSIRLLHLDEALIVVEKPAPLPMHPCGRYHRNTLQHLLSLACAPEVPRPLHRLDANTSGLVAFARTRHFCRLVQRQFEHGTVGKSYLARVHGHPAADEWTCDAPISDQPGPLGSRAPADEGGLPSLTRFRVLTRLPDGQALLEALPLSGRTNQIRVHLWHSGHPLAGDPAYLPDGSLGDTQTLAPEDPPMGLHAWKLDFDHPLDGRRLRFESTPPAWASVARG